MKLFVVFYPASPEHELRSHLISTSVQTHFPGITKPEPPAISAASVASSVDLYKHISFLQFFQVQQMTVRSPLTAFTGTVRAPSEQPHTVSLSILIQRCMFKSLFYTPCRMSFEASLIFCCLLNTKENILRTKEMQI